MTRFLRLLVMILACGTIPADGSVGQGLDEGKPRLSGPYGDPKSNPRSGAWPCKTVAGLRFLTLIDGDIVREFRRAWSLSKNGSDGREGALLVYLMPNGRYKAELQRYVNGYRYASFTWNPSAVAIVHTHPNNSDPEPTLHDQAVSDKYGVPIFTLTEKGMFVYEPTGRTTRRIMPGTDWLELSSWNKSRASIGGLLEGQR